MAGEYPWTDLISSAVRHETAQPGSGLEGFFSFVFGDEETGPDDVETGPDDEETGPDDLGTTVSGEGQSAPGGWPF